MENRFSMVIASNTTTYWQYAFNRVLKWRAYSQHSQDFNIGKVIDMGTVQPFLLDAYDAPSHLKNIKLS
jgi:hypothetical protein